MDMRVLGPVEVWSGGSPVALGSPKERALFAVLVVHANTVVSIDRLADELWDGSPPDQAVAAVRVYVSHLRKVLPEERLVTRGSGYELVVSDDELDAARFEHGAAQGRTQLAGGDATAAAVTFRSALGEWRGTPFDDVQPTACVAAEAVRLAEERLGVVEDRIDADLQCGRHREVVGELTTLVGAHPLRERLWGQLIMALYRCGRQADALRAYQQARARLIDELGIEPGAELRQIEKMVLAQDTALDAPRAVCEVQHNLPASRTTFVGRERELAAVSDALQHSRLVTLTGTGGVGKTRLAIEAARSIAANFTDGVWFAEFGGIGDPQAVSEVVTRAVGIDIRQGVTIVDGLLDALRTRRVLLVLDNCEHLVGAVAGLVVSVALGCPNVSVLATSREGLDVDGERIIAVAPLQVDGSDSDALQLFAERALDAGAPIASGGDDATAATELCRRLDGIPLAIELAAARMRSMTAEELLARIDERFRLLTVGRRGAVSRHQTLRRALDWSHELLDEAEQVAFCRLAVFAGDFDLAAAEGVCDADLDVVSRLVDKSLIVASQRAGATRYRFLETTREYAVERLLESGEADAVTRRHGEYFAAFAAQVGAGLRSADEVRWNERLQSDFDNLRAAVAWAVEVEDAELAVRAIAPLAQIGLDNPRVVSEWAETVVTLPGADRQVLYPCVLALAGFANAQRFDVPGALERAHTALSLARRSSPQVLLWTCSHAINVLGTTGRLDLVEPITKEWIVAARSLGDRADLVRALTQQCSTRAWQFTEGDPTVPADEAVQLARELGQPSGLALALSNAGMAYTTRDKAYATALLTEALEVAERAGYQFARCLTLWFLAQNRHESGDFAGAISLALAGMESARRTDRFFFTVLQLSLAGGLLELGAITDAAILCHRGALAIFELNPRILRTYESLVALPERFGRDEFESLAARGDAMTEDEVLEFVRDAVERARVRVPT